MSILTVPGLAGSGPDHWQTLWERKFPTTFRRVEQENWDLPDCETWVEKLNDEIQKTDKPTYLVAHSLGCITVVHWANQFVNRNILGALLVAPADRQFTGKTAIAYLIMYGFCIVNFQLLYFSF